MNALLALTMLWCAQAPVVRNTVAYVTGPDAHATKHRMDVYRPQNALGAPVMLFFHGGVWQLGDKEQYANVGRALAERGVVTAVVNYRLTPEVKHPAHVQDAARAVVFMHDHAADYGGDPKKLWLSGHSAGGQMVTLLLLDKHWLQAAGMDADTLAGVMPLSGIFDLTRPIASYDDGGFAHFIHPPFGKDRAGLLAASPITHIRKTPVPIRVVLAGQDDSRMQEQSRVFVALLQKQGLDVRFSTVPGRGHFEMVTGIGATKDTTADLLTRLMR